MFSEGIERSFSRKLVKDYNKINIESCFYTLKRFSSLRFKGLIFFFILQKHVEGKTCNKCKVGYFNLQEANPDGCTPCFCNGLTKHCRSANFGRKQVRIRISHERCCIKNAVIKISQFSQKNTCVGISF